MITRYEVQNMLRAELRGTPISNTLAGLARTNPSELLEGQTEQLAWLGNVAPMRVHQGGQQPGRPVEYTYAIRNEKFSNGVSIPGGWWRNDKTALARTRINQLAQRYQQWPGRLVAQLIEAGFTGLAHDNKPFFAPDHSIGKSTFSNLIQYDAAVANAPTANECSLAIARAITTMAGFLDDQGEPMNEGMQSVTIVCHTSLGDVMEAALSARQLDTGTGSRDNTLAVNKITKNLIVSPRFTGLAAQNRIAVFRSDAEATPFVMQENLTERRLEILADGSDHYVKLDEVWAAMYAVGNAGYGNPQDAIALTFT